MNVFEALAWIQPIYNVCCLSPNVLDREKCVLRTSKLLISYTIVVVLVSIGVLVYGLFSSGDIERAENDEIGGMVDFIQMVGIRVSHVISVLEMLIRRKEHISFFTKVQEIDQLFETRLSTNVDNNNFRRETIKHGIIAFSIYFFTQIVIITTKIVASKNGFSPFWILYSLPFLVCCLRYFQIYICVTIIRRRLTKLVEILSRVSLQDKSFNNEKLKDDAFKLISQNLSVINSHERPTYKKYSFVETNSIKQLIAVREAYNRIWELNNILNRFVGVSLLINIGNDFISITSNAYWIFINFKDYSSTVLDCLVIAASAIWTIPHLFNVLVTAITCDQTAKGTTRMALSLHNVQIDIFNESQNTLIEQFSMQLLHQKLAFSAAGFFIIDCSLLYAIVGSTTTYLIILIQFHMSELGSQ